MFWFAETKNCARENQGKCKNICRDYETASEAWIIIVNIKTLQNKAFECVKKYLPNIVITGAYDVEDKIDEYDKRFGEFPTMAFEECEEEV